jgi:hypothetical protein
MTLPEVWVTLLSVRWNVCIRYRQVAALSDETNGGSEFVIGATEEELTGIVTVHVMKEQKT